MVAEKGYCFTVFIGVTGVFVAAGRFPFCCHDLCGRETLLLVEELNHSRVGPSHRCWEGFIDWYSNVYLENQSSENPVRYLLYGLEFRLFFGRQGNYFLHDLSGFQLVLDLLLRFPTHPSFFNLDLWLYVNESLSSKCETLWLTQLLNC